MERLELHELGDPVGWVEFDPYEYAYSGDSADAAAVLENGPVDTIRVGEDPPEELSDSTTQSDTVRETTVEERKEMIVTSLSRVGVVVDPVE